jgi:hypothetical protein
MVDHAEELSLSRRGQTSSAPADGLQADGYLVVPICGAPDPLPTSMALRSHVILVALFLASQTLRPMPTVCLTFEVDHAIFVEPLEGVHGAWQIDRSDLDTSACSHVPRCGSKRGWEFEATGKLF